MEMVGPIISLNLAWKVKKIPHSEVMDAQNCIFLVLV